MNRKYILWAVILLAVYMIAWHFGLVGNVHSNLPVVTEASFAGDVEQSKIPVLVDFWASWCPPCRAIAPIMDELAEEFAGRVKVCKVDVDESPQLAERFQVEQIPCLILFRNGEVVDIQWGANSRKFYREWLQSNL